MLPLRSTIVAATTVILVGIWAGTAWTQTAPAAPGAPDAAEQRPNNPQDRRAQFLQRRFNQIKETLNATDEEWVVLQPRIEKVMTARMQTFGGGMMGGRRGGRDGGGPGGPGGFGGPPDRPQTEITKAVEDLRAVLDDPNTSASVIKTKLETLRTAREKAKQDLVKAQQELRKILNLRQEAQLVLLNLLD